MAGLFKQICCCYRLSMTPHSTITAPSADASESRFAIDKTIKLSRATLAEQIKDTLLNQILTGSLAPGERLIELKIAAEMHTSQAPVREAIRELESLGIVEVARNRGARVSLIDDEELREIYDVRAVLEGYAAELAAQGDISIETELRAVSDQMLMSAQSDDHMAFSEQNLIFHRTILESTLNHTLREHWERLNIKMQTFVNVRRKKCNLMQIAKSHDKIIDAIAAKKPELARAEAISHVQENRP